MLDSSSLIIIPARLNSSRFPRKILETINGKPMIIHILEKAESLKLCDCYIACCCDKVKSIVESFGGKAIVTDPELPSGTDRVYAAAKSLAVKPEFIINLQGDTAVFDEAILPSILNVLKSNESIDMTTPVIRSTEIHNPNVVKVIFNNMEKHMPGKAIYFSRKAIPDGASEIYSHIGIYAYRFKALKKFVSLEPSYLERIERLEQLRGIQNDINIFAVPVSGAVISVDVKEDLSFVRKSLLQNIIR
jgi:3-deoxy-manno-octulosonate cytidylyltransferase (CMP-KDO synthetase)